MINRLLPERGRLHQLKSAMSVSQAPFGLSPSDSDSEPLTSAASLASLTASLMALPASLTASLASLSASLASEARSEASLASPGGSGAEVEVIQHAGHI